MSDLKIWFNSRRQTTEYHCCTRIMSSVFPLVYPYNSWI